jgi:hypothetical protein
VRKLITGGKYIIEIKWWELIILATFSLSVRISIDNTQYFNEVYGERGIKASFA